MKKAIYLDICVLCRPFDDQRQARIRLETGALQIILAHIRSDILTMIISSVHQMETLFQIGLLLYNQTWDNKFRVRSIQWICVPVL